MPQRDEERDADENPRTWWPRRHDLEICTDASTKGQQWGCVPAGFGVGASQMARGFHRAQTGLGLWL